MRILERVVSAAKAQGMKSLALAFAAGGLKGHSGGLLTPPGEKAGLIRSAGINEVKTMRLDSAFLKMSPAEFFMKVLVQKYGAAGIIVGGDFRFGKGRAGDVGTLSKLCSDSGINFESVPIVKSAGRKVSSTEIRNLLKEGRVEAANRLLGREYSVSGVVKGGRGLGKKMGFPTANIKTERDKLLPRGVFAGRARSGRTERRAIANIGTRPTFGERGGVAAEVFMPGFSGDLRGMKITFFFRKKIRDERKFSSVEELKKQIGKDLAAVRKGNK